MDPSKPQEIILEESHSQLKQEKKQKSLPKFNRKVDVRLSQKKRSIDVTCIQHRISYISPGKNGIVNNFNINSSGIQSPTFEDVMHKFTIKNEELSKLSKSTNFSCQNGFQTSQKECTSEECKRILAEKENKVKNLKSKLQKMKERTDCQKEQMESLKSKSEQFDTIQAFLLQRETFISQIMENNTALNQNIAKSQIQTLKMEDYCKRLTQEKDAMKQKFERKILHFQQMMKRNNEQKQKSIMILEESASKKKKSMKKTKQNNENINQSNVKRSKTKSASMSSQLRHAEAQFCPYDLNVTEQQQVHDGIKQHEQHLINNLQQKIRYSEIQIDVLKKIKLDSSKVMKDNQNLKFQNRKLLNRISYLTRNFSRRGDNSDSSLQLSLSPKAK